ncbi:MAG TPA: prepilin-type N-terminal cleavage/methylation domain-containing protein [Myxococcaceae bacterium]|nr:prepilin-type N-terminal cleavage/methylation domain-containing protein [Myxococcaceae bacterium]
MADWAATVTPDSLRPLRRGFTLIELMMVVAILSILAAIAVPNFIRYQARTKQGEVKMNLRAIFSGQRSLFGERDLYSPDINIIGFTPERGNRYAYRNGTTGVWQARNVPGLAPAAAGTDSVEVDTFRFPGQPPQPADPGGGAVTWTASSGNPPTALPWQPAAGSCPRCEFVATAVGNIDSDATLDGWFISSADGVLAAGPCTDPAAVPGGTPWNRYNDLGC